jgi:hypothetical protein
MPGTTNYRAALDGTNLTEPAAGADRSGAGNEDQRETNRLKVLVQAVKALEAFCGIGSTTAAGASAGQVPTRQATAGVVEWATPAAGAALASTVAAETSYGLAATVGVSANVAREDHTHGTPERPTYTETFSFGDDTGAFAVSGSGAAKFVWAPMRQIEVLSVRAVLYTVSSSGSVSIDVNTFEYSTGTVASILTASGGNLLVTSGSRSAARTLSPTVIVVGSTHGITVDIDAIGTGARFLTVTIRHQEA